MKLLALLTVFAACFLQAARGQGIRGCYFTNWSQYRPGPATFLPEDIDPALCSHIFYAFADMEGNRLVPIEWNDEDLYARVNAHKSTHPNLKTLLTVGGWSFDLEKMSDMLATQEDRAEFIESSIEYLRLHDFDGLDMDFEYPGYEEGGSIPEDKERFTLLCQEMRVGFDAEGVATGRDPLLMAAAVAAGKDNIDNGYEIDLISQELDFIMLMTFDLHGSWEDFTGAHTALYPRTGEQGYQLYLNMEFVAEYWLAGGASSEKIVLGMASHSRGFTLEDSEDNGMGAPAIGGSPPQPFTNEEGYFAYYEVCIALLNQGATRVWHDEHQVPYAYRDDVWNSYDDEESLQQKLDFMGSGGYGGWMIWALDLDDFRGTFCGQGTYPLIRALNQANQRHLLEEDPKQ